MSKKLYLIASLFLVLGIGLVSAANLPHYPTLPEYPSFTVMLTEDGENHMLRGDPFASITLLKGDMARGVVRGLEPHTMYSLYRGSDCLEFYTNSNGAARAYTQEFGEYDDAYEWVHKRLGGYVPMLKMGEASEFRLYMDECGGSKASGLLVLEGVEHKSRVREQVGPTL